MNDLPSLYFSKLESLNYIPKYSGIEADLYKIMDHFIEYEMEDNDDEILNYLVIDWKTISTMRVNSESREQFMLRGLKMSEIIRNYLNSNRVEDSFLEKVLRISFQYKQSSNNGSTYSGHSINIMHYNDANNGIAPDPPSAVILITP